MTTHDNPAAIAGAADGTAEAATMGRLGALVPAVIAICMGVAYKNLVTEEDDGYRSSRERATIKKFDKDGDGELNKEESKAAEKASRKASEERKKAYLEKFDKDGDGELNKEEREAAGKASGDRKKAYIEKFDKDGDGKLSKKETRAAKESSR